MVKSFMVSLKKVSKQFYRWWRYIFAQSTRRLFLKCWLRFKTYQKTSLKHIKISPVILARFIIWMYWRNMLISLIIWQSESFSIMNFKMRISEIWSSTSFKSLNLFRLTRSQCFWSSCIHMALKTWNISLKWKVTWLKTYVSNRETWS